MTTTKLGCPGREDRFLMRSTGVAPIRRFYVCGPGNMPVEQSNNTNGEILYLYHDQAGITRLLTGYNPNKQAEPVKPAKTESPLFLGQVASCPAHVRCERG